MSRRSLCVTRCGQYLCDGGNLLARQGCLFYDPREMQECAYHHDEAHCSCAQASLHARGSNDLIARRRLTLVEAERELVHAERARAQVELRLLEAAGAVDAARRRVDHVKAVIQWDGRPCEHCEGSPIAGILVPADSTDRPDSVDGKVYVQRCDECGKYLDDAEAAEALVEMGLVAEWRKSMDDEDDPSPAARERAKGKDWFRPYVEVTLVEAESWSKPTPLTIDALLDRVRVVAVTNGGYSVQLDGVEVARTREHEDAKLIHMALVGRVILDKEKR